MWSATECPWSCRACVSLHLLKHLFQAPLQIGATRTDTGGFRAAIRVYNNTVSAAKTLRLLMGGTSDAAIRFDDLCSLFAILGFEKRVKGSHHLFRRAGVEERIILQRYGGQAK